MTSLLSADATLDADDRPWPRWLLLLACLGIAAFAYAPAALRADFLNFDDNLYFGPDNPLFQAASARARESGVFAALGLLFDPRQVVADVYLPVAHASRSEKLVLLYP